MQTQTPSVILPRKECTPPTREEDELRTYWAQRQHDIAEDQLSSCQLVPGILRTLSLRKGTHKIDTSEGLKGKEEKTGVLLGKAPFSSLRILEGKSRISHPPQSTRGAPRKNRNAPCRVVRAGGMSSVKLPVIQPDALFCRLRYLPVQPTSPRPLPPGSAWASLG